MTQREFFNAVIAGNITEAEIQFANEALAKLDAKNEKRKGTQTKNQKANENIKTAIIALLTENETMTAKAVGQALEITTQKASALLRQLVGAGTITGTKTKASAPFEFSLVNEVETRED